MSLLSAEIAATCSALGYFNAKQNKYYADSNTLETVKDLIRYLRRDDENHDIRRQLGEIKVLQSDLLPLLKNYYEEDDLFDVLLRLIMNLTTPPLLIWNFEIPKDKTIRNFYLQVDDHLKFYKEAFTDEGVWAVLSAKLSKILEIDPAERGDENGVKIERILILIRNILFVPAEDMERRPDNDANIHDQVVWSLQKSGMLDIILYMTSSATEQAYYMYILEIIFYMCKEQQPGELAKAALVRTQTEKIRDEAELLAIRHRETNQKLKKVKMYSSTRHSRFGGTFVVQSMKSISDNDLIYHKPLSTLDSLNFDADKKKPKTAKNRQPLVCNSSERRSAFTIRLILKEFCVEFLYGAYNSLMHHIKDNLVRSGGESYDESVYFWAIKFFMAFNRYYKFEVKLVSETMSVQIFHYIQQRSEHNYDLMQTDKKKLILWSQRLHKALLAYCELLHTLCAMDKSPDGTVRDASKVIKSNIFYVPEYREFILTLLVTYDELKMSDVYLKDLLETQHVFLKMFESYCGKDGTVVVQKKGRNKKTKKKNKTKKSSQQTVVEAPSLESQWDEAGPQLSAVLESGGEFLTDVVPFDAASDVPIDEQKSEAMKKIQGKLREGEFEAAIGLMRAAREVWPENDCFGSSNITPEEEFLAIREIFIADLGNNQPNNVTEASDGDDSGSDDEYDEDEEGSRYSETTINFNDFIKRLPHPKVVRACGLALRSFETNSITTNHYILKLLHRIAFDCKMYVMVFQLSIFRTFQRIFTFKDLPQFKELVKFATYITRQFFKVSEKNQLVFVEALFWKSSKDACDIESGYETIGQNSNTAKRAWSEEEEDELRRLFMEHQNNGIQEDVVDWLVDNLIDNTKSRRMVLKKLKEMLLLIDYKAKRKSGGSAKSLQQWSNEEEALLKELYEEFKDAVDPLERIRLEIHRPKNRIVEKMLTMGLIQDKKELRKKRVRSGKAGNKKSHQGSSNQFSESDSDSDDPEPQGVKDTARRNLVKHTKNKQARAPRKQAPLKANKTELAKLLQDTMAAGQEEALSWLKDSLSDAIEDFEEDSDEGVALVPIMDYAVAAMETDGFKKLLKALGVVEPFLEQEAYWRIPGELRVDVLEGYCELIQQALDNTLSVVDTEEAIGGDEVEAVEEQIADSDSEEDTLATDENVQVTTKSLGAKHRNLIGSDSDDEVQDKNAGVSSKNAENHPSDGEGELTGAPSGSRNRSILDTDSDDEVQDKIVEVSSKNAENLPSDGEGELTSAPSGSRNRSILDTDSDDEVQDKIVEVSSKNAENLPSDGEGELTSAPSGSRNRSILDTDSDDEVQDKIVEVSSKNAENLPSDGEGELTSAPSGSRNRSILDTDSDDEVHDKNVEVSSKNAENHPGDDEGELTSAPSGSRNRSILDTDSEEEDVVSKRPRADSNSESEKRLVKRSRMIESEDE